MARTNSFSLRIDKAVAKAKVRIAAQYNISLETIEAIMKKRDGKINKELSEIVDEKREELLELLSLMKRKILPLIASFKYGNAIKNGIPILRCVCEGHFT